jgi:hypothetical protein
VPPKFQEKARPLVLDQAKNVFYGLNFSVHLNIDLPSLCIKNLQIEYFRANCTGHFQPTGFLAIWSNKPRRALFDTLTKGLKPKTASLVEENRIVLLSDPGLTIDCNNIRYHTGSSGTTITENSSNFHPSIRREDLERDFEKFQNEIAGIKAYSQRLDNEKVSKNEALSDIMGTNQRHEDKLQTGIEVGLVLGILAFAIIIAIYIRRGYRNCISKIALYKSAKKQRKERSENHIPTQKPRRCVI